jgi:CelD/BcsL family acetyltransferase involved in cellulose biosynthesis
MGTLNVLEPSGRSAARSDSQSLMITSEVLPSCEAVAGTGGSTQTATYSSWESLADLIPSWEAILRDTPSLSVFSTPEWLQSWWEAFGTNRHLVVLAFSDKHGSLFGIAPLYWENSKHSLLGGIKQLRLVGDGSGDSDNLDFIVRRGEENRFVSALMQWINSQNNCGVCSFNTLPADSSVAKTLISHLQDAKWPARQTSIPNSAVPLPSTWESYIEGLSPKFRRLITRCRRKLDAQYQLRFRRCERAAEIPEMLETLYSLHQKRWNSINEPGSFNSAERRELYKRMAAAFLQRGWLELWTLELNDRPVAAQMSFRYRDRVYGLQEGFDTDFFSQHVGYVLRAGMFEHFIRSGVKTYDFLGGFNAQKQRWGAELGAYTNLQFATPWSIASCYLALDKGAAAGKEWLRHHLPSAAWSVLHRVKISLIQEAGSPEPEVKSASRGQGEGHAESVIVH